MSKYSPLTEYLGRQPDVVVVSFAKLDEIVGGLPPSARSYSAWWNDDDPTHSHCRSWNGAGFTAEPDLGARSVTFRRR